MNIALDSNPHPAAGLGTPWEPCQSRGEATLSMDVSLWLCRATKRQNELVVDAHGHC